MSLLREALETNHARLNRPDNPDPTLNSAVVEEEAGDTTDHERPRLMEPHVELELDMGFDSPPNETLREAVDRDTPTTTSFVEERTAAHQRWGARTLFVAAHRDRVQRRTVVLCGIVGVLAPALLSFYTQRYFAATSVSGMSFAVPVGGLSVAEPLIGTRPVKARQSATALRRNTAARETTPQRKPAETVPSIFGDTPIIVRTKPRPPAPSVDPLTEGYAAYQRGDMKKAEHAYRDALKTDPRNRNALLGLAAIAMGRGDMTQASDLYGRLLQRDPTDGEAFAGMLNLKVQNDEHDLEARLTEMLTRHPQSPHLHLALGNIYARQQRWAEAQSVYTRALALNASRSSEAGCIDPEFAFNLAVSLEHLGRRAAALDQYRAALACAKARWASFDPTLAESRIEALTER